MIWYYLFIKYAKSGKGLFKNNTFSGVLSLKTMQKVAKTLEKHWHE